MDQNDFDELAGRDDALYRTLGLLIRHLHVKRIIHAPDLLQEMRLLSAQMGSENPVPLASIAGMEAIAATLEGEQPLWTEGQVVADLYRDARGAGQ